MPRADPEDYAGNDQRHQGGAQPETQIVSAVGNRTDDLRRKRVAEQMNAEQIDGNRGSADRAGNGIHDGGVKRPCVEEEKELGREQGGNGPRGGPKKTSAPNGRVRATLQKESR